MTFTRPQNVLVLLFGAAVVVLGSVASGFLLTGPLGVGYAHVAAKMLQGQRAELDDVFWRGFDRFRSSIPAGFVLGLATTALTFVLFVPGLFGLLFSALVFSALALDAEEHRGFASIHRVIALVRSVPTPLITMALIASLIGVLLSLTVVGTVVMVAFFFLVAVSVYHHYFDSEPDSASAA